MKQSLLYLLVITCLFNHARAEFLVFDQETPAKEFKRGLIWKFHIIEVPAGEILIPRTVLITEFPETVTPRQVRSVHFQIGKFKDTSARSLFDRLFEDRDLRDRTFVIHATTFPGETPGLRALQFRDSILVGPTTIVLAVQEEAEFYLVFEKLRP